ncbi:MAG: hypothetical protein ISR85_06440 [Kiritimatiellales bacterium]|nr:hypothetical protein [Kiritimatiellota bacterium]MBL7012548.1 hypothetical protein [Kiritimatiellales bacterium]
MKRLLLLAVLLTGCQTLVDKPAEVPFRDCYVEITDPQAHAFVREALTLLTEKYAGPRQPVETVHLRTARRNGLGRAYRIAENFSKTEVIGPGEVVIYIAVPPGDNEFYPMLGHECGHLLDPTIEGDWEMEGFCMIFSEEICERTGHSWAAWQRRYPRRSSDPYAKAYWKAKEAERHRGTEDK